MDQINYLTIETFTAFKNVDRSILKLNALIGKYGYVFQSIPINDLEKQFGDLFHLPRKFESTATMQFDGSELKISSEFYQLLTNSSWGHQATMQKEVFFLKRIQDFELKVVNKSVDPGPMSKDLGEMRVFVESLVQQLRLHKNGDIYAIIPFQIQKIERHIISRISDTVGRFPRGAEYTLSDVDIEALKPKLKPEFKASVTAELALSAFNLSYQILDARTRFITLMTCLESIFNLGKDQITHTVSRHLAIIISNSEEQFSKNYKRIKKLYSLRSSIVHGSDSSSNVQQHLLELENLVRHAINYCQDQNVTKTELFYLLNSSGYSNSPAVTRHNTWSAFYDNISLDEYKRKVIPPIRLKSEVSNDVTNSFSIIEKLLIHAYFEYEFLDVAYTKALQTFEMALKLRYKENTKNEWSQKAPLAQLIKWFEDRKSFEVENPDFMNHVRNARNYFSHPSRYGFGGSAGLHWIQTVVDLINDLYEDVDLRNERILKRKELLSKLNKIVAKGAKVEIGDRISFLIYKAQVIFVDNKRNPVQFFITVTPVFENLESPHTPYMLRLEESTLILTDTILRFSAMENVEIKVTPLDEVEAAKITEWKSKFKEEEFHVKNFQLEHMEEEEFKKIRRAFHFQNEVNS